MALMLEVARSLLEYDPSSPSGLRWKVASPSRKAGESAGGLNVAGYYTVSIQSKIYRAHRVIWLLCTGDWPSKVLDHIDGNKTNNTLENLRDVTVRQNNFNKRGTKGFHWSAKWGKWVAAIRTEIGSNPKYLGAYDTELDARAAYLRAKSVFHKF